MSATTRSMPTAILLTVDIVAGVGNVAAERAVGGSPRSYRWVPPPGHPPPFPFHFSIPAA